MKKANQDNTLSPTSPLAPDGPNNASCEPSATSNFNLLVDERIKS